MDRIHGMVMRPASMDEASNEEVWKRSEFYTDKNFMEEYRKHMIAMQHVAECAKIYITKNWEKVEDWSDLNINIKDNTGKRTRYYNHKPEEYMRGWREGVMKDMMKDLEKKEAEKHNPIKTVEDVVLDPSDGDFSLTINGKAHLWIDDESVVLIAEYIEKKLENGTTDNG